MKNKSRLPLSLASGEHITVANILARQSHHIAFAAVCLILLVDNLCFAGVKVLIDGVSFLEMTLEFIRFNIILSRILVYDSQSRILQPLLYGSPRSEFSSSCCQFLARALVGTVTVAPPRNARPKDIRCVKWAIPVWYTWRTFNVMILSELQPAQLSALTEK